jgi:hypothetical protein
VFLLLPTDRCAHGESSHDDQARERAGNGPVRSRWQDRLLRCVQQMAVYLGDAYLAAEGCRGDVLCATPEYFEDALYESRRGHRR